MPVSVKSEAPASPPRIPDPTRGRPLSSREPGVGLNILVMGKAGTGKSTLIRGLFGKEARESVKDLGTPSITTSDLKADGVLVKITFWKSPGIYDGISKDQDHVRKMKEHLDMSDLVIYALRMDDTRLRPEDIETMQKLSRTFGDDLWVKGIVALTFANRVYYLDSAQVMTRTKEHVTKRHKQWEGHIHANLREGGISEAVIRGVPIVPAGYYAELRLFPDEEPWMSDFVRQAALRMQEDAKLALLKLTKVTNR